jgi:protein-S-isoprenylcysteine O-methyltransferase Ste14
VQSKQIALMADIGERLLLVALAVPWLIAFARFLPRDPGLITAILSEGAMVFFILIRKPGQIALTPYAFAVGFLGTCFALFVRPVQTTQVTWVSSTIMLTGFAISLSSKLALNRRFGIVAANRGIQTKWPYSVVRHPMYAGYVITQVGFFITSPTLWNGLVYAVAWTLQLLRIFEEEKLLRQDDLYQAFARRVRYRLVPGVF